MIGYNIELFAIAICMACLFLLSLVECAITQSSPLALRMLTERHDAKNSPLLALILENEMQVIVPLHFGIQVFIIIIAILITHLNLQRWPVNGLIHSFLEICLVSVLSRQLVPRLLTQNEPEKKVIRLLRVFNPFYRILRALSLPLSSFLNFYKRMHEEVKNGGEPEPETTEEEIQAYLEIGEDEGILQEEDSRLIQSVVEFGDTLVREVMTPRTHMIACDENATMSELRELMVEHRHSRIPIYRGDVDHVIGIAYIRQLMAELVPGRESQSIAGLVNPVLFVPETKPVAKLLKDLQLRGDHAAIVIDEFGGVAGLVTIEDLVEEIVGEIQDEDEAKTSKIIEEGPRCIVVRGSTELSRLEERAKRKFEGLNCSTVAGLVMAYLGRVPATGETFELEGLGVRILDADRKRVHWIRIQLPETADEGKTTVAG